MFIIYTLNINKREIKFSSTINAFHSYWPYDKDLKEKNLEFNKLAMEAYKTSNKISLLETNFGFSEEIAVYKGFIFAFICTRDYKLLFNYLPEKDLFLFNNFPNITKYQLQKINDVDNQQELGTIKMTLYNGISLNYKVLCTYEALLNYCKANEKEVSLEYIKEPLYNDFLKNLTKTKVNTSSIDPDFGLIMKDEEGHKLFNYVYFDKLIIITNYRQVNI